MKKAGTVILSLMLVTMSILTSCKKNETPDTVSPVTPDIQEQTETPDKTGEKDEAYYTADLSKERYDGYNFRMLLRKGQSGRQYFEDPQEDIVDDAVYRRNKKVEDLYGITITASESANSNTCTEALNSILSGDDAYDAVLTHSRSAFVYGIQGAAYNIHDIEAIQLEKPWWSKDLVESCTVNGNLFVLDGDISVHRLQSVFCLYFNKRIFDEMGFDYPYELVKENEWTLDEFAYMVKKMGKDLDGDGVINPEVDQYGFSTGEWFAPINILYASGKKVCTVDDNGLLKLDLYSPKTVDIYDDFFAMMNRESSYLQIENVTPVAASTLFTEGRAAFHASELGAAQGFRNMDDDFGILPYPKYDENDDFATTINAYCDLIVVPITVTDVERTGSILEALCAYGSKEVVPAFYDVSLKVKNVRDTESEEMVDLIRDSIVYDVGYAGWIGSFGSLGREMCRSTNRDFASFYAARESQSQNDVDEFNIGYGKAELD